MGRRRKPPSPQHNASKGEGVHGGSNTKENLQSNETVTRVSSTQSDSIVEAMKAVFSAHRSEANSGLRS